MKTVRSLADATRAALNAGAVVSIGGRRLNESGQRLPIGRPAPQPEPPRADPLMELVAELREQRQAATMAAAAQAEQMQALARTLIERTAPVEPPKPEPVAAPPAPRQAMTLRVVKGSDGLAKEVETPRGRLIFTRNRVGLVTAIRSDPPAYSFAIYRDKDDQLDEVVMTPT